MDGKHQMDVRPAMYPLSQFNQLPELRRRKRETVRKVLNEFE